MRLLPIVSAVLVFLLVSVGAGCRAVYTVEQQTPPGEDFHLLEQRTFARHTLTTAPNREPYLRFG